MKYEIFYLPIAGRDITNISDALYGHPGKARWLLGEIESSLKLLEFMPYMWPLFGPKPELRRMELEGHLLFYTVNETQRQVRVYRVLPGRADTTEQASGGRSGGGPSLRVVDIESAKSALDHELEAVDE